MSDWSGLFGGLGVVCLLAGFVWVVLAGFGEKLEWGLGLLFFSGIAYPLFLIFHWRTAKPTLMLKHIGFGLILLAAHSDSSPASLDADY